MTKFENRQAAPTIKSSRQNYLDDRQSSGAGHDSRKICGLKGQISRIVESGPARAETVFWQGVSGCTSALPSPCPSETRDNSACPVHSFKLAKRNPKAGRAGTYNGAVLKCNQRVKARLGNAYLSILAVPEGTE
jgi:hypothetical protein